MRRLRLLTPLMVLLAACEAPADDDVVAPANHLPRVAADPTVASDSATPTVAYVLSDEDGDPCSVDVEWSLDGLRYQAATRAGGDDPADLPATAEGIAYSFSWDAEADVGGQPASAAWLRFTPRDPLGRGPSTHVQASFALPGPQVRGDLLSRTFSTADVGLDQIGIALALMDVQGDEPVLPPAGPVLDGADTVTPGVDGEAWSYTLPLPETPPSQHLQPWPIADGVDSLIALYVPVAYVDEDGDGGLGEEEAVVATSVRLFVVALDYGEAPPAGYPEAGWYGLSFEGGGSETSLTDLDAPVDLYLWANEVHSGTLAGSLDTSALGGLESGSYRLGALATTLHGVLDELASVPLDGLGTGEAPPASIGFEMDLPAVPGDHLLGPYFGTSHSLAFESLLVYRDADGNGVYEASADPVVAGVAPAGTTEGSASWEGLLYVEGALVREALYYYVTTGCAGGWSRFTFDGETSAVLGCAPLDAFLEGAAAEGPGSIDPA
ncbi:hypothetical protein L6R50_16695 [Myxococcota bacterium]|nr:hypothetical protein [Myxococcota bacterium]